MTIGVKPPELTLLPALDGCNLVEPPVGELRPVGAQSGVNYGFECQLAARLSESSFYVQVL